MADETKPNTDSTPTPEIPNPPKSSDIVSDKNARQLRELQERFSKLESQREQEQNELSELREIVRKLGELPPKNPTPDNRTLLDEVNSFIWAQGK